MIQITTYQFPIATFPITESLTSVSCLYPTHTPLTCAVCTHASHVTLSSGGIFHYINNDVRSVKSNEQHMRCRLWCSWCLQVLWQILDVNIQPWEWGTLLWNLNFQDVMNRMSLSGWEQGELRVGRRGKHGSDTFYFWVLRNFKTTNPHMQMTEQVHFKSTLMSILTIWFLCW